jgi:hypothetical protein
MKDEWDRDPETEKKRFLRIRPFVVLYVFLLRIPFFLTSLALDDTEPVLR